MKDASPRKQWVKLFQQKCPLMLHLPHHKVDADDTLWLVCPWVVDDGTLSLQPSVTTVTGQETVQTGHRLTLVEHCNNDGKEIRFIQKYENQIICYVYIPGTGHENERKRNENTHYLWNCVPPSQCRERADSWRRIPQWVLHQSNPAILQS